MLEICLQASENIFFVPAHVWTPWFSVLGAKSGFDSLEECYEDLTKYIYAAETGLSSDPPMNWICSILDKFTLISNSDAHSPEKAGKKCQYFQYRNFLQFHRKCFENGKSGTVSRNDRPFSAGRKISL